jgi:hypothetical protein
MKHRSTRNLGVAAVTVAFSLAIVAGAAGATFNFNAHPFSSGKCNAGDTGSKCGGQPGNGWAQSVSAGPEHGAERLGSWQFGYGGLNFDVPKQPITFSQMTQLQTDYEMSWGSCSGGSPRWQVNVLPPGTTVNDQTKKQAKNIFVYFGSVPTSGSNACPEADGSETNSGNYIGSGGPGDVPGRYDTSQLAPGTQISNYTATNSAFGDWEVVGIQLVVDGGWAQGQSDFEQEAIVDQVQVNGTTSYKENNPEDTN